MRHRPAAWVGGTSLGGGLARCNRLKTGGYSTRWEPAQEIERCAQTFHCAVPPAPQQAA
jgi:hypothetical protein